MSPFRRRLVGGLVLAAVLAATGLTGAQPHPGSGFCGYARVMTPPSAWITSGNAYQQIGVGTTAVSPTVPTVSLGQPVVGAIIQTLNGLVNERHDGTAPTASTSSGGMTYGPNSTGVSTSPTVWYACGSDLTKLQLILSSQSATATSVNNIIYYVPGS